MTTQLIQHRPVHTVKAAGMWCVLSLASEQRSSERYLGSLTSIQPSGLFTARNPRKPEGDTKAALD